MNDEKVNPDLQKKRNDALHFMQEYVSALQTAKQIDSCDPAELERAERALFALDPENPLIRDFAEAQNNVFEITFREAGVQYIPHESKPMFEFPGIDNVKEDCRFFGKCVLFTGFYPEEKAQIAPIVDFLRINQPSGVCQKLDFLICGSNAGPAKIKKAEEMGKTIILAADFIQEITGHAPRDQERDDFQNELL